MLRAYKPHHRQRLGIGSHRLNPEEGYLLSAEESHAFRGPGAWKALVIAQQSFPPLRRLGNLVWLCSLMGMPVPASKTIFNRLQRKIAAWSILGLISFRFEARGASRGAARCLQIVVEEWGGLKNLGLGGLNRVWTSWIGLTGTGVMLMEVMVVTPLHVFLSTSSRIEVSLYWLRLGRQGPSSCGGSLWQIGRLCKDSQRWRWCADGSYPWLLQKTEQIRQDSTRGSERARRFP